MSREEQEMYDIHSRSPKTPPQPLSSIIPLNSISTTPQCSSSFNNGSDTSTSLISLQYIAGVILYYQHCVLEYPTTLNISVTKNGVSIMSPTH